MHFGRSNIGRRVDTLVQLATQVIDHEPNARGELAPNTGVWVTELLRSVGGRIDPSLSITSNLGGAQFLIRASPTLAPLDRDRNGLSIGARNAAYLSKLLRAGVNLSVLPRALQVELFYALSLAVQISSDQLSMAADDGLFGHLARTESES